jgi:hypothetical protein
MPQSDNGRVARAGSRTTRNNGINETVRWPLSHSSRVRVDASDVSASAGTRAVDAAAAGCRGLMRALTFCSRPSDERHCHAIILRHPCRHGRTRYRSAVGSGSCIPCSRLWGTLAACPARRRLARRPPLCEIPDRVAVSVCHKF